MRNLVRVLALSDEFTLYALFLMRRWADGNDAVWEAAQHVSGWGRIHAVAQLEPGSDAIRRWLLLEGWRNNVAPDYSALTCVEKSGLAEALHSGALDSAEFTAAGELLPYLLSEGPVAGISALENSGVFLQDYLTPVSYTHLCIQNITITIPTCVLYHRYSNFCCLHSNFTYLFCF